MGSIPVCGVQKVTCQCFSLTLMLLSLSLPLHLSLKARKKCLQVRIKKIKNNLYAQHKKIKRQMTNIQRAFKYREEIQNRDWLSKDMDSQFTKKIQMDLKYDKILNLLFLLYYMSKNPNSKDDALFVRLREIDPLLCILQTEWDSISHLKGNLAISTKMSYACIFQLSSPASKHIPWSYTFTKMKKKIPRLFIIVKCLIKKKLDIMQIFAWTI